MAKIFQKLFKVIDDPAVFFPFWLGIILVIHCQSDAIAQLVGTGDSSMCCSWVTELVNQCCNFPDKKGYKRTSGDAHTMAVLFRFHSLTPSEQQGYNLHEASATPREQQVIKQVLLQKEGFTKPNKPCHLFPAVYDI
jgi:hypothetical protein